MERRLLSNLNERLNVYVLIRRASDRDAFLKAPDLYPSFRIETCPWGGEYRPETSFSAAHSIPPSMSGCARMKKTRAS